MSWRDRLLQAEFRGVPFHVDAAGYAGGRRTVTHEYPGRDVPLVEDLGRRARRINLEAFTLGPDYDLARDNLRAALEAEGAGILVHPHLGRLRVRVAEVSLRETTSEGGLARFTVAFIEEADLALRVAPDTAGQAKAAASAVSAAAAADFTDGFDVGTLPGDYVAELQSGLESLLGDVEAVVSGVTSQAAAVIRAPANLAAAVAGGLASIRAVLDDPLQAFGLYKGLLGASSGLPALATTPGRRAQAAAEAALTALVRRTAAAEAATSLAEAEYSNATEAETARDDLLDSLDALLADATGAAYQVLASLRAAVVRDTAARGADLARIVRYTVPATEPALVTAHRLYGDATRDAEIVSRNGVRHPGFVPGGQPLEVLSDAG